jgi:AcrR family transcriptional regulator
VQAFRSALERFDADQSPQGRVLQAGLSLIETQGIDRVTVAAILAEAKVARGTVYAHFGGVFGVFASAWTALGRDWLRVMMTEVDEESMSVTYNSALVQILCAARRAPILNEVVQPDVDDVWAELDRSEPIAELRAAWLLTMRLSKELSIAILPETVELDPLISIISAMPADSGERYQLDGIVPSELEELNVVSPLEAVTDPIAHRLVAAAVEVAATSGLASASMLRVCRAARLTPGAAIPRFNDLRALHDYAFTESLADVVRQNREQFMGSTAYLSVPDRAAAVTFSSMADARLQWRRCRQEFHLAARTDPALATMMRTAITATDSESIKELRATGVPESIIRLMVLFTHVNAAGVAAVDALGLPMRTLDHRLMFRWVYETLSGIAVVGAGG